jgi:hypothetical protein
VDEPTGTFGTIDPLTKIEPETIILLANNEPVIPADAEMAPTVSLFNPGL